MLPEPQKSRSAGEIAGLRDPKEAVTIRKAYLELNWGPQVAGHTDASRL